VKQFTLIIRFDARHFPAGIFGGRDMVGKSATNTLATTKTPSNSPETAQLLHDLIDRSNNHALLMEFIYWSADPALVKLLRQYIALPDITKIALSAFLTANENSLRAVTIETIGQGTILITSKGAVPPANESEQHVGHDEMRRPRYASY